MIKEFFVLESSGIIGDYSFISGPFSNYDDIKDLEEGQFIVATAHKTNRWGAPLYPFPVGDECNGD